MIGSKHIFGLSRIFEQFEDAVLPAQRYKKFSKSDDATKALFATEGNEIKGQYENYVLSLKETLKNIDREYYFEDLVRILSMPDSFFAKPVGEHRKQGIIRLLDFEAEFKFLNNSDNFCAASGPYIGCPKCANKGSLCDEHFEYGRSVNGDHIADGDINPNKGKKCKLCGK